MFYRKMWLELFTEVVAGFLILFFLFGWMDILIIAKWFRTPDIGDCSSSPEINGVPTCIGQYKNRQIEGIITIMVTTVFGFGNYAETTPEMTPIVGGSLNQQYSTNMALVYIAVILILVMLCTKPCIVKLSGGHQIHEENQIEFQAINQNDNADVMRPQSINPDNSASRDISTDQMVQRRENQMRSLDDQLKKMGSGDHGDHSFGEVFIH